MRVIVLGLVLAACADQDVAPDLRSERFGLIRDAAHELGVHNAALLAGIAISETNLAHCHAEASYSCPGPASPSCGGEPIIAGGADGPCSAMEGGLGMFQFDAGTYADTLAMYGDRILTVEGNTAQAVDYVIEHAIANVAGVTDPASAVRWINEIPIEAGAAEMGAWAKFIACRYNGCCSTSTTCVTRANGYRDNAIAAYEEMGAEFWATDPGGCSSTRGGGSWVPYGVVLLAIVRRRRKR